VLSAAPSCTDSIEATAYSGAGGRITPLDPSLILHVHRRIVAIACSKDG
jgi:hypothetical protein